MRISSLCLALVLPLSACTFVKMAPGGERIQVVAQTKDMSACEKRGEIVVSVKDRLGPYETLARNEAPSLRADSVQPKAGPEDGEQRFTAYRCVGARALTPPEAANNAETVPLKE